MPSSEIIVGGYDLETTGFCEPEHRIIEACVKTYTLNTETFEALETAVFTQRYDPKRSIPPKSTEVHGITAPDLIGKPTFEEEGQVLLDILNACDLVVAHNGISFDFPFTIMEADRCKLNLPDFEPFDSMMHGRWSTPFGDCPSLKRLCFAAGVEYDVAQAHAADYDVDVMMQSFFFGLRQGWFKLP